MDQISFRTTEDGYESNNNLSVNDLEPIDFQSKAAVPHETVKKTFFHKMLPFTQNERHFVPYGEVARYVVVKNEYVFVYFEKTDLRPLYTLRLSRNLYPEYENNDKPHSKSVTINPSINTNRTKAEQFKTVLLLETKTKKLKHQFTFDISEDNTIAKRFFETILMNKPKKYDEFESMKSIDLS